jgi:hypothetical protein
MAAWVAASNRLPGQAIEEALCSLWSTLPACIRRPAVGARARAADAGRRRHARDGPRHHRRVGIDALVTWRRLGRAVAICMQVTGAPVWRWSSCSAPTAGAARRTPNDGLARGSMSVDLPPTAPRVLDYGQYVALRSRRCPRPTSARTWSRWSRRGDEAPLRPVLPGAEPLLLSARPRRAADCPDLRRRRDASEPRADRDRRRARAQPPPDRAQGVLPRPRGCTR